MRRLGFVVFALLFLLGFGHGYAETEWFYTNLSELGGRQVILSARYIGGHLRDEAKTCPADGAFLCYDSPRFSFAVPKVIEERRKWTLNRTSYEIKRESRFNLLGKEISIVWIDQRRGNNYIRFLYSKTRGLIGFVSQEPKGPLFLLENACGFAASPDCAEIVEDQ